MKDHDGFVVDGDADRTVAEHKKGQGGGDGKDGEEDIVVRWSSPQVQRRGAAHSQRPADHGVDGDGVAVRAQRAWEAGERTGTRH